MSGPKLSRHVLGMKFMRKTKEQFGKSGKTESIKSEPSVKVKPEPGASAGTSSLVVEELWSYNQCEKYIFGRQSYGGFNPTVEKNLRKGTWKPLYLDEGENPCDSSDDDVKKQSDVDVSDDEMKGKIYGSLIGTLGKRFQRKGKQQKNKNKNSKSNQDPQYSRTSDDEDKSWKKMKRNRESTGSTNFNDDDDQEMNTSNNRRPSPSKRSRDQQQRNGPPQKRRKFLKPSD